MRQHERLFKGTYVGGDSLFREGSENLLHHGEVLPVVVRLEEGEAEVELEHDASHAPNITGLRPAVL